MYVSVVLRKTGLTRHITCHFSGEEERTLDVYELTSEVPTKNDRKIENSKHTVINVIT
jgi:hypothetical protein